MTILRKFVNGLTDLEKLEIMRDFDQFERDGAIGDCLLRSTARRFLDECIGGDSGTSPVMWMNLLTAEIWRSFAMRYIGDEDLVLPKN